MTNTTRRSFIKKSVVAAIAVTNVTVFSGLVDASAGSTSNGAVVVPSPQCELLAYEDMVLIDGNWLPSGGFVCFFKDPSATCTPQNAICGTIQEWDNDKQEFVDVDVSVKCKQGETAECDALLNGNGAPRKIPDPEMP